MEQCETGWDREREREGQSHLDTAFETKMGSSSRQFGWLGSGAFIDIQSIWLSLRLSCHRWILCHIQSMHGVEHDNPRPVVHEESLFLGG